MSEKIEKLQFITNLPDGRLVIYENDYGTNNNKGYAVVFDKKYDRLGYNTYKRYQIKIFVKDDTIYLEPDLDRPLK